MYNAYNVQHCFIILYTYMCVCIHTHTWAHTLCLSFSCSFCSARFSPSFSRSISRTVSPDLVLNFFLQRHEHKSDIRVCTVTVVFFIFDISSLQEPTTQPCSIRTLPYGVDCFISIPLVQVKRLSKNPLVAQPLGQHVLMYHNCQWNAAPNWPAWSQANFEEKKWKLYVNF